MNWKQLKQKKIVLKKWVNTNRMVEFSVDGAQVSFGQLLRKGMNSGAFVLRCLLHQYNIYLVKMQSINNVMGITEEHKW